MHIAITGASSGIGQALALALQERATAFTLVARRGPELEALAGGLRRPAFLAVRDLAVAEHAVAWVPDATAAHGPIEMLINCAGVMDVGATSSFDLRLGQRMMELNLLTPLRLVQAILPGMLARGRGVVINVASLAGLVPVPGATWYSATKAGLGAYSEGLRAELRGSGIKVLTVYPGPVETRLAKGSLEAYGNTGLVRRLPRGTPEVLARRILGAVDRDRARVIYPSPYLLAHWFPRLALALAARSTPPLPTGTTFSLPPPPPGVS